MNCRPRALRPAQGSAQGGVDVPVVRRDRLLSAAGAAGAPAPVAELPQNARGSAQGSLSTHRLQTYHSTSQAPFSFVFLRTIPIEANLCSIEATIVPRSAVSPFTCTRLLFGTATNDLTGGARRGKGAMVISHTSFVLKRDRLGWGSCPLPHNRRRAAFAVCASGGDRLCAPSGA